MNFTPNRPLALVIVDGWGISPEIHGNAIAMAHTPNYDNICARYPVTKLAASGSLVGLREGVPGNAEIGHVNIGAGRTVQTDAVRIADEIASGSFFSNEVLATSFANAAANEKPVHFIGMLSDGDVHSSANTLYSLLRMAKRASVSASCRVTSGRRSIPTCGRCTTRCTT